MDDVIDRRSRTRWAAVGLVVIALLSGACGLDGGDAAAEGPIRLYTSVTEDTVQAVVDAYAAVRPDETLDVFRAPTGEVGARIAAEQREGGVRAHVLWLSDPLSMQQYAAEGLLETWSPEEQSAVPDALRTDTFAGTRILNLVMVHGEDVADPPSDWWDLARSDYDGDVAVPDPGFAGSAFAALAYFALTPEYGFDFYRELRSNGGVQVRSPGDVVAGVAEGQFGAGITLDRTARDAIEAGSPIAEVWPDSGAVAVYSPIGVVEGSSNQARSFADFVLTQEAQEAIASTGWQPVRDDVAWEHGGPQVTIDWSEAFDRQQELLDGYQEIFGG